MVKRHRCIFSVSSYKYMKGTGIHIDDRRSRRESRLPRTAETRDAALTEEQPNKISEPEIRKKTWMWICRRECRRQRRRRWRRRRRRRKRKRTRLGRWTSSLAANTAHWNPYWIAPLKMHASSPLPMPIPPMAMPPIISSLAFPLSPIPLSLAVPSNSFSYHRFHLYPFNDS